MAAKARVLVRIYFAVTIILLIIYFFARVVTPFWVDAAFIAWCGLFVVIFGVAYRNVQTREERAGRNE